MKILLVEDDLALVDVLKKTLMSYHYIVDVVSDGEAALTYGLTFDYDLIILDILLPKMDGITLCQELRSQEVATPILLLTSQDNNTAKVRGLDAGADDYVVKPFDLAELMARIRALLRRGAQLSAFPVVVWGDLILNPSTCEVTYRDRPINLTAKEYELLELLLQDSQHVFSTEEILERLWPSEEFPVEATVRSHIRRLREKLADVGAPHDLVATARGRGYYLRSLEGRNPAPPSPEVPTLSRRSPSLPSVTADQKSQYVALLNETWPSTQAKSLESIRDLFQQVMDLKVGANVDTARPKAQHLAHKLAGTLGVFGLTRAEQLARHLEHLLSSDAVAQQQAPLLQTLLTTLKQEVEAVTTISQSHLLSEQFPLLLIVDEESPDNEALSALAADRGIRTAIAPTLNAVREWFVTSPILDEAPAPPDAILLRLSDQADETALRLDWLQTLTQEYPEQPVLVVGQEYDVSDRLEVIRRGGRLFLPESTTPTAILDATIQLLSANNTEARVMVVDDDATWLQTLPALLSPWSFKITTLDDPEQFWNVLQAVTPDALVLDVKMPTINGFEICQMLRSDPRWQRLPILFVSVLDDPNSQHQAFDVGADDYLCKPVQGNELAQRIQNRLQRTRAWLC